jgi:hypothetical protein
MSNSVEQSAMGWPNVYKTLDEALMNQQLTIFLMGEQLHLKGLHKAST